MKPHSNKTIEHSHGKADYIGITGSLLCLVHCLVTPAMALGTTLSAGHAEAGGLVNLDYFFILLNGAAIYYATLDHKLPQLRIFMWSSFALFAVAILLEKQNHAFEILGYVGSVLLIGGHVYNLLFCRPWLFKKTQA
ncbi:MAG: MerC domain-containing protein [Bacteroidetes bacterium]|nr:MerC domain-containing protein [Bacteroidota bacterium]